MTTIAAQHELRKRWIWPAQGIIVLTLCALLASWTWHAAGDPMVDSARDLYAAQRMAAGDALYRQLHYLYGPLAPGVISLLFRAANDSPNTVRLFDVATIGAFSMALLLMLNRLVDATTAAAVASLFLVLGGFAQFTGLRNYSFILPYTHSATFGMMLTMLCAGALIRSLASRPRVWIAVAGGLAGLTMLTKPEMALAGATTLAFGGSVVAVTRRDSVPKLAALMLLAATAFVSTPLLMGRTLCWNSSFREWWSGVCAPFRMAIDPRIQAMPFFADDWGKDSLQNLLKMLGWAIAYGATLLPPLYLARQPRLKPRSAIVAGVALVSLGWLLPLEMLNNAQWADIGRGVPAVCLAILGFCLVRWRGAEQRWAARLIFAVAAVGLLLRMVLHARIYHYGFVQLSAGLMLIACAGLCWIPEGSSRQNGNPHLFRAAVAGLLLALTIKHLQIADNRLRLLSVPLAGGYTPPPATTGG